MSNEGNLYGRASRPSPVGFSVVHIPHGALPTAIVQPCVSEQKCTILRAGEQVQLNNRSSLSQLHFDVRIADCDSSRD